MDEKVLDEIRFHEDALSKDINSPLFQIREKEMEISGRVFAARTQADKMITDARQRAQEIVRTAHSDAERLADERAASVNTEVEDSIKTAKADGAKQVTALEKELAVRQKDAADFIVKLVTSV